MAYLNKWDELFENFTIQFPVVASKVIDWWPSGRFEIAAKLQDGSRIIYDGISDTIKTIKQNTNVTDDEEEWKKIFSARLNKILRDNYISLGELSDRTGLSRQVLSGYINARRIPSGYNLVKIAKAIGCSVTELTEFCEVE